MAYVDQFQALLARVRDAASSGVGAAWDGLGHYNADDVAPFVAAASPLVVAAQTQAAVLTDAYLAAELGRSPLGVDPSRVTGAAVRGGTSPDEVYRRPFVGLWKALAEGTSWADAVNAGRARAASTATTDVQLAMRAAARDVMSRDRRVVGYRRVLAGQSCKLCTAAARRTYRRQDLMPVHPNCKCTVAPLLSRDQGPPPAEQDDAEVVVHEHGELGPVLTDASHTFTN